MCKLRWVALFCLALVHFDLVYSVTTYRNLKISYSNNESSDGSSSTSSSGTSQNTTRDLLRSSFSFLISPMTSPITSPRGQDTVITLVEDKDYLKIEPSEEDDSQEVEFCVYSSKVREDVTGHKNIIAADFSRASTNFALLSKKDKVRYEGEVKSIQPAIEYSVNAEDNQKLLIEKGSTILATFYDENIPEQTNEVSFPLSVYPGLETGKLTVRFPVNFFNAEPTTNLKNFRLVKVNEEKTEKTITAFPALDQVVNEANDASKATCVVFGESDWNVEFKYSRAEGDVLLLGNSLASLYNETNGKLYYGSKYSVTGFTVVNIVELLLKSGYDQKDKFLQIPYVSAEERFLKNFFIVREKFIKTAEFVTGLMKEFGVSNDLTAVDKSDRSCTLRMRMWKIVQLVVRWINSIGDVIFTDELVIPFLKDLQDKVNGVQLRMEEAQKAVTVPCNKPAPVLVEPDVKSGGDLVRLIQETYNSKPGKPGSDQQEFPNDVSNAETQLDGENSQEELICRHEANRTLLDVILRGEAYLRKSPISSPPFMEVLVNVGGSPINKIKEILDDKKSSRSLRASMDPETTQRQEDEAKGAILGLLHTNYSTNKSLLLDIDSTELEALAYNITIRNWTLIKAIKENEFFTETNTNKPNLSALIDFTETTQFWVISSITFTIEVKDRANLIEKFIKLATLFKDKYQNMQGFCSIIYGLYSSPVSRLTKTWDLVSNKGIYDNYLKIAKDSTQNFHKLRAELAKFSAPFVYPMFFVMNNFAFVAEKLKIDGIVYCSKINRLMYLLQEFQNSIKGSDTIEQLLPPPQKVSEIAKILPSFQVYRNDDLLFELSLLHEPRSPANEAPSSPTFIDRMSNVISFKKPGASAKDLRSSQNGAAK